jgi:polyisoprenoid-binding protein YceI
MFVITGQDQRAGITTKDPSFRAGTWDVDPNHTEVSFTVGHLVLGNRVISKVRGRFDVYSGTIVTDEDLGQSSVNVTIDAASVDTHLKIRDDQIRGDGFLDTDHFPNITFASSGVRFEGGQYFVDGDLTIRGTTRPVTLDTTMNGFLSGSAGEMRVSFAASITIDRNDFGVSYNSPIPGVDNAMTLSDDVLLTMDVEAILRQADSTS